MTHQGVNSCSFAYIKKNWFLFRCVSCYIRKIIFLKILFIHLRHTHTQTHTQRQHKQGEKQRVREEQSPC